MTWTSTWTSTWTKQLRLALAHQRDPNLPTDLD
jgi:hypothetical protein